MEVETDTPNPAIPETSHIEKTPPRPAPTQAYNWTEFSPGARILYTRDQEEANRELSKLKIGPLGFDLEWKPNYVKGQIENRVALVQLADDETIFLIQISAMRALPTKLVEILANPAFLKAGVGIQDDTTKLLRDWLAPVRGVVDLTLLARTVDNARWKGKYNSPIGLARLVEVYQYRLLEKGKIRRTNWEKVLLPEEQTYAANDAHSGYMLYKHLIGMADPNSPPPPQYYTFNREMSGYCEPSGLLWHPHNPDYDPGPPPPPRVRREKDKEGNEAGLSNSTDLEPQNQVSPRKDDPAMSRSARDRQGAQGSSSGRNNANPRGGFHRNPASPHQGLSQHENIPRWPVNYGPLPVASNTPYNQSGQPLYPPQSDWIHGPGHIPENQQQIYSGPSSFYNQQWNPGAPGGGPPYDDRFPLYHPQSNWGHRSGHIPESQQQIYTGPSSYYNQHRNPGVPSGPPYNDQRNRPPRPDNRSSPRGRGDTPLDPRRRERSSPIRDHRQPQPLNETPNTLNQNDDQERGQGGQQAPRARRKQRKSRRNDHTTGVGPSNNSVLVPPLLA